MPTSVVAPGVDETAAADATGYVGDDIFIKAKSSRRDRLPVSLRQGRHVAKGSRRARRRSYSWAQAPQRMYLVDEHHLEDNPLGHGQDDGHGQDHDDHRVHHEHHDHAETTRIALRLSFEDFSSADMSEAQESVAG
ncbi:MAG TPA: hypothetical protein VK283_06300 [Acidimicrobiales bacterium]|nr:hypothetical protein [Acidimicrobiales bacterium]